MSTTLDAAPPQGSPATPAADLSPAEVMRYSRHLILPEVGKAGQLKLKRARVLLVGTGGLGSPLALYLAAAGVGTLGLVDFDVVDESNLQRQVLHGTADLGRPKLDSAADRIADLNPNVRVVRHATRLTALNALEILEPYDVVVDGTDNFPTRYLVNDACVMLGKPNVYGSIFRFEGQLSVFWAERGPCYRCLFREPPPAGLVPSCAEGGVLGVLPGIIGSLQALEVIKLIVNAGDPMIGRFLLFDALGLGWRELKVRKDPGCPVCGVSPTITELEDLTEFCTAAAPEVDALPTLSPAELNGLLAAGQPVTLVDVREPHEWDIVNLRELGAMLIPLAQVGARMAEIDPATRVVVHCKGGSRSAKAVGQLRAAGYGDVWNLDGGILAWADQVDPSKPKY
ncbi:MAG TPA: molybdopterin-synthase adenylyltransferase MoeB [Longimicrobium sp.]|nr:molybdopterin-synthase adenylyltransferase MoeB [Longimicrobium sp.]